ncbi:O-antigen ligase family protein [Synechococcus sp. W4D4]|uniref:O-antigen ligase family protein n=1 Tax=Synechococcus sp. W4D4 TaxID=3392294 RepID=UPI0039E78988
MTQLWRRPLHAGLELLDGERPAAATPWGWRCFQVALLLLPASALLAGLLLLVALILGSRQPTAWRDDRVNWWLAAIGLWMVLGCFAASSGWLSWVGLGNWLPFFWAFWGFQPYLATPEARRRVALWLVAGTVPVLGTGFGQMVLGWSGPYELLGGAIVWWIRGGGNPPGRLSGLFDYANITAAWLALSWPLVLAAFLQHCRCWRSGPLAFGLWGVSFALVVIQVAEMLATDSRNGWGALVLAVPIVLGPGRWIWLVPLLLLALLPVALATLPGVPAVIQAPLREIVPQSIWGRLNDFNSQGERPLALTRLSQWGTALGLIGERPWLGWGAAAFSVIYPLRTGHWHGHPHNIALDLALSHGLPVALGLVGLVLWLLIRGVRLGMASGALFERAWWAAALVLVVLHATDIPMYDSRLNIAGWILLAGLRCRF